jgi:hypothetical protein
LANKWIYHNSLRMSDDIPLNFVAII